MVYDIAHDPDAPSKWVERWAPLIPGTGMLLDLACGGGRHVRYFAGLGFDVTAVDRDASALAALAYLPRVRTLRADLEGGNPWPFPGILFDGVVVTRYLHRPLFPHLRNALAPGGVLIYETFATGNERYGRPSNPEFLLWPGELLQEFDGLEVLGFEEGLTEGARPAVMQRICVRQAPRKAG